MNFWDTFINSLFGRSTSGQLITPTRQKIIQSQKLPAQALPVNNYTYKPKALKVGMTQANQDYNEKILSPYFAKYSVQYGIPYGILRGVCKKESSMGTNPIAHKSRASNQAQGIMQIVPASHPGVNVRDPEQAIAYSAKYLRELHNNFKSWQQTLTAYNIGAGNMRYLLDKYGNNWQANIGRLRNADPYYARTVSQYAGYAYT